MPPLTCPDKLTYYAFSRVVHPVFEKHRGFGPVDPAPFIAKAHSIEALMQSDTTGEELQAICDRQYELAEELEGELQKSALYTASIILSFQGSDLFGNARPYDSETISEPFFSGITLYNEDHSGEMFCAIFRAGEVLAQKHAYREMAEHPFFTERSREFEEIEKIFETLRINGSPADWTIIGILRSYYLFSE
jgi:hypothetical protein